MTISRRGAHLLARHRRAGWNRAIAKACRAYLNGFDNLDYDSATNGEEALLDRLSLPAGATVLDVGANKGSWSRAVRSTHPEVTVHAFEIDPVLAGRLADGFAGDPGVVVVPSGLSDRDGTATLHRDDRSTRVASLVAPADRSSSASTIEVAIGRGDAYLDEHGLGAIRFVKIDTEGNDLNVVRGFGSALEGGRIDALQFEHNEWSIPAGVHLKDFYDVLTPLGYEIGRLFPDCVLFRPWRATYEREAAGNHVAVHRDRIDLRAELAGAAR